MWSDIDCADWRIVSWCRWEMMSEERNDLEIRFAI